MHSPADNVRTAGLSQPSTPATAASSSTKRAAQLGQSQRTGATLRIKPRKRRVSFAAQDDTTAPRPPLRPATPYPSRAQRTPFTPDADEQAAAGPDVTLSHSGHQPGSTAQQGQVLEATASQFVSAGRVDDRPPSQQQARDAEGELPTFRPAPLQAIALPAHPPFSWALPPAARSSGHGFGDSAYSHREYDQHPAALMSAPEHDSRSSASPHAASTGLSQHAFQQQTNTSASTSQGQPQRVGMFEYLPHPSETSKIRQDSA